MNFLKQNFRQDPTTPSGNHFHTLYECRVGNNDVELWVDRKIEGFNHKI